MQHKIIANTLKGPWRIHRREQRQALYQAAKQLLETTLKNYIDRHQSGEWLKAFVLKLCQNPLHRNIRQIYKQLEEDRSISVSNLKQVSKFLEKMCRHTQNLILRECLLYLNKLLYTLIYAHGNEQQRKDLHNNEALFPRYSAGVEGQFSSKTHTIILGKSLKDTRCTRVNKCQLMPRPTEEKGQDEDQVPDRRTKQVVLKQVPLDPRNVMSTLREALLLRGISHNNIQTQPSLIMLKGAHRRDLRLGQLSRPMKASMLDWMNLHKTKLDKEARQMRKSGIPGPMITSYLYVLRDVLSAMMYLHHRNVHHSDLKPENILLANGLNGPVVTVMDFGISRLMPLSDDVLLTGENDLSTLGGTYYPQQCLPYRIGQYATDNTSGLASALLEETWIPHIDIYAFAVLALRPFIPIETFPSYVIYPNEKRLKEDVQRKKALDQTETGEGERLSQFSDDSDDYDQIVRDIQDQVRLILDAYRRAQERLVEQLFQFRDAPFPKSLQLNREFARETGIESSKKLTQMFVSLFGTCVSQPGEETGDVSFEYIRATCILDYLIHLGDNQRSSQTA